MVGWRRWFGLVLVVSVVGLTSWTVKFPGNSFHPYDVTEERAARIQKAIETYHAKTSWYPLALKELIPGELLRIPLPMIIPGQSWCYQGGPNYYRLGAVYREHWSSPYLSVRVYASAGDVPDTTWECDEKLSNLTMHNEMDANSMPVPTPLPTSIVSAQRTVVEPILKAPSLSVGKWSPDGKYLVFGTTRDSGDSKEPVEIDLQFLNAETGETCQAAKNKWKAGERSNGLYQHYAWLPDGNFLYVSETGEVVSFTPCVDNVEDLTNRYPTEFTQAITFDAAGGRVLLKNQDAYWLLDGVSLKVTTNS